MKTAPKAMPRFVFRRVGYAHRNGKAYYFGKNGVTVLKGWPAPLAWHRRGTQPWRHVRLEGDIVLENLLFILTAPDPDPPYIDPEASPAERAEQIAHAAWEAKAMASCHEVATRFFETTPPRVMDCLRRFKARQWSLFSLLARCPGADALAEANPALFFALANNWAFHKPAVTHPLREARRLIRRRQRIIAGWLGFPATSSACRVLAKIRPQYLTASRVFNIRRALLDPDLATTLQHLPAITGPILDLIGFPLADQRVGPAFLHDLATRQNRDAKGRERDNPFTALSDARQMAHRLRMELPTVYQGLDHLRAVHDRLTRAYDRAAAVLDAEVTSLPPPPLPGTETIQPLTTPAAVREEGTAMQHCAASYVRSVAAGYSYLYRVLSPVRATLEIRQAGVGWEIAQLRGPQNAAVPKAVERQIAGELFSLSQRVEWADIAFAEDERFFDVIAIENDISVIAEP